jgi:hypothetical protein
MEMNEWNLQNKAGSVEKLRIWRPYGEIMEKAFSSRLS